MTVYSEGPFRQWQAVSWPTEQVVVRQWVSFGSQSIGRFGAPFPDELEDVSILQGLITGKESGAQIDFSNVPIVASDATLWTFGPFPGCETNYINLYKLDGTLEVAPNVGYVIGPNSSAEAQAVTTRTASATSCDFDNNAAVLTPTFIVGEEVTITYPDE